MKELAASIALVCFIIFIGTNVEASWLIDVERFHVSAHGQISCQDCHADITANQSHPNPTDVNMSLKDHFRPEQCIDCHEGAGDDIVEGTHGGETVTDRKKYSFCIECHDPHYQMSYSDAAAKVDLNQPVDVKCSACHEFQKDLPELTAEDEQCMGCHQFISQEDPRVAQRISRLCFHCHGTTDRGKAAPKHMSQALIDTSQYASTVHAGVPCTVCHGRAAEFIHAEQSLVVCRQCHLRHDAKVAHDAHLNIACGACHLREVTLYKDAESGRILWQRDPGIGDVREIHKMATAGDEESCRSCHFSGNTLGAAAMVLPAKSIICMPCHAATFSVGDTTTIIALVIFFGGILFLGSIWFSGNPGRETESIIRSKLFVTVRDIIGVFFSTRILAILKALILDALLQRRLFRISKTRWLFHALIFYPFVIRFGWGMIALVSSLWWPEWSGAWVMVDKNNPLTAFVFDVTGGMVILGVVCMLVGKKLILGREKLAGLPKTDWPAFSLLGGIIMAGFILEGMRIAMTGSPPEAGYAFLGYAISRLFSGVKLTETYGYVWYLHAIFTVALAAYLPFSRMLHVIMAPVSLAINGTSRSHRVAI